MSDWIYILEQFTGVLLQTLPVAILVGCPLEDEEFRGKRRNYYMVSVIILVVFAIIFAVLAIHRDPDLWWKTFGNGLMGCYIFLFSLYYFYMIRAKSLKKLILVGIGCSYAAAIFLINSLFVRFVFGIETLEDPYVKENIIGLAVLTVLTFPLLYWYMIRVVRPSMRFISDRLMKKQCASVLTGLFLFCLESSVMPVFDLYTTIVNVVFIIGITVVMYYLFFNEIRLMQEQYELMKQMDNFEMQSKSIGKNIEEMKRMHHNIHHHLNVIGVLNQEGKQKEIAEYLSRYEKIYRRLETERLSGYMILDSVLRYYLQEMEEEQIPVKTHFQIGTGYDFDPMDITVLFGNCLENAIEEQRRLPVSERLVSLDIQTNGQLLLIGVKNRCMAGIAMGGEFADWRKFPSSKRSSGRGEGLHSIDIIAKKYKGSARFQRTENWFVMHVMLQIP